MNQTSLLDEANRISVQRLIRHYLAPEGDAIRTLQGACVTMKRIGNRYGVPADAATFRYEFVHPDLGFAFSARAVWRCNDLMRPATHTVIEDYEDQGGHGSAVRSAVNDWLRSM